MRASTTMTLLAAVTMMVLVAAPVTSQEPSHGGSLTNTGNEFYVVQGDAQNPRGVDAGYGGLYVSERISFANDDPAKVPDYGIVYVDPTFTPDPTTPRMLKYTHEYTIANYTLQLINATDEWVGNFTGLSTTSASLMPGPDLGPEGPDEPHPKVNATYTWVVYSISEQGRPIESATGGEVVTEVFNDTVLDWSGLDLPGIGPHTYEADEDGLAALTLLSVMEPHPSLSEGWYRFRLGDQVFEYGVSFTFELRYSGEMADGRGILDKFVFTGRPIQVEVYHPGRIEVLMFNEVDGKGSQIPPTATSSGAGDPTVFSFNSTFSLVVQEPDEGGTDWGLYGRYALLAVLVGVLLFLVLWSGRDKEPGPVDEGLEDEDPEIAERRAQLERRKEGVLAAIKDLDRKHDAGEVGDGVWRRKRRSLKNRAVEAMRDLEGLGSGDGDGASTSDENGDEVTRDLRDMRELEREKATVLKRIKELDNLHDDGELDDDDWQRQRKALKAEAVEIVRDMEELEEEE